MEAEARFGMGCPPEGLGSDETFHSMTTSDQGALWTTSVRRDGRLILLILAICIGGTRPRRSRG